MDFDLSAPVANEDIWVRDRLVSELNFNNWAHMGCLCDLFDEIDSCMTTI
jgi:hypothetical protein